MCWMKPALELSYLYSACRPWEIGTSRLPEEPLSEQILVGKLRERDHVIVQAAGEQLEFMRASGTQ